MRKHARWFAAAFMTVGLLGAGAPAFAEGPPTSVPPGQSSQQRVCLKSHKVLFWTVCDRWGYR